MILVGEFLIIISILFSETLLKWESQGGKSMGGKTVEGDVGNMFTDPFDFLSAK